METPTENPTKPTEGKESIVVKQPDDSIEEFKKNVEEWTAIIESMNLLFKQNDICTEILKYRPNENTVSEDAKKLWERVVAQIKEVIKAGKPQLEGLSFASSNLKIFAECFRSFVTIIGNIDEYHFTIPKELPSIATQLRTLKSAAEQIKESNDNAFNLLVNDARSLLDLPGGGAEALRTAAETIAKSDLELMEVSKKKRKIYLERFEEEIALVAKERDRNEFESRLAFLKEEMKDKEAILKVLAEREATYTKMIEKGIKSFQDQIADADKKMQQALDQNQSNAQRMISAANARADQQQQDLERKHSIALDTLNNMPTTRTESETHTFHGGWWIFSHSHTITTHREVSNASAINGQRSKADAIASSMNVVQQQAKAYRQQLQESADEMKNLIQKQSSALKDAAKLSLEEGKKVVKAEIENIKEEISEINRNRDDLSIQITKMSSELTRVYDTIKKFIEMMESNEKDRKNRLERFGQDEERLLTNRKEAQKTVDVTIAHLGGSKGSTGTASAYRLLTHMLSLPQAVDRSVRKFVLFRDKLISLHASIEKSLNDLGNASKELIENNEEWMNCDELAAKVSTWGASYAKFSNFIKESGIDLQNALDLTDEEWGPSITSPPLIFRMFKKNLEKLTKNSSPRRPYALRLIDSGLTSVDEKMLPFNEFLKKIENKVTIEEVE